MDVTPSTIPPSGTDSAAAEDTPQQKNNLPEVAPFGPPTWNILYYVCIAVTAFVGVGTILNGGMWTDALVRMFVTLLGGLMLVMAFITFVVVPLHVRHYENVATAQKAARLAARANEEHAREEKRNQAGRSNPGLAGEFAFDSEPGSQTGGSHTERSHNDQAASLRRMAADLQ